MDYRDAGVDITAADAAKARIKTLTVPRQIAMYLSLDSAYT